MQESRIKTKMKLNKYIFVLILYSLFFTLSGCRPKGILHSGEMREVLVDLHKTDALLQISGLQNASIEEKNLYYAQVLKKHGITQAQFDSSIVWYTAHPQLFDKIYPKVMAELKDEETRFLEENGLLLAAETEPASETIVTPEFHKADLDSILWITRNGMPTHWQPLVHDFEDEFFPQVGVLR